MNPFAIYPGALDDDTLLYARADSGWLRGESVKGPTLVNHGAVAGQDGFRFVRADSDRMEAAFPDDPGHTLLTMECWMRDFEWVPDAFSYGSLFCWYRDSSDHLWAKANTQPVAANSRFTVRQKIGGSIVSEFSWSGEDVDAMLKAKEPIHVALVLDSTAPRLSLYVNGRKRAEDTVNPVQMPAANYKLNIGCYDVSWQGADYGGVIDEVRLSKVARYNADFPITRFGEGRRALTRGPGAHAGLFAGVRA